MMTFNYSGYGQSASAGEYWSTHRSKIEDLYRSEKYFFTKIIPTVTTVLDLGCATGGSLLFSRELNRRVSYVGIDISSEFIEIAKKRFENYELAQFMHFGGDEIPLTSCAVDFAFSFGVFHHLPDWKKMTNEFLRVTSRYALFDIRVWEESTIANDSSSFQKIALGEEWDGKTVVPYNIQSYNEVFNFFSELLKQGVSVKLFGYYSVPTSLAITPAKKVLMLAVLLEKNVERPTIELMIDV